MRGKIPTPVVEDRRTTSELRTERELKQADSLVEFDRQINYAEINQGIEKNFGVGQTIVSDFGSKGFYEQ